MLFMVTFPLTHRDYETRISRFLETGAPPPEGVTLRGRWFTASHSKGFILAETDDATALFRWMSEWTDIIDFVIEPVVRDDDQGILLGMLNRREVISFYNQKVDDMKSDARRGSAHSR